MKKIVEGLGKYFEENPPNLGDAESIIDLLYWYYSENNPINNINIKNQFATLRSCLHGLTLQDIDRVCGIACDLCYSHEKLAFTEGLRVGFILMEEVGNR